MALGIWLYVLPPTLAVPLVLVCSVIAQVSTLPSIWKSIDFRLVWPFVIAGLAGVPIGILLIARADPGVFKLTIGVFLLVFPTLLFLQRKPMSIADAARQVDATDALVVFRDTETSSIAVLYKRDGELTLVET